MNLPLINDCLFFDNSTLEKLQTCMRSVEYYKIHNKIREGSRAALRYGGGIHAALEARYKDPDYIPGVNDSMCYEALEKYFNENPCEDEGWRNLDTAATALSKFLQQEDLTTYRPLYHNGKPLVEMSFAAPLALFPHPDNPGKKITLVWMGKIDRVVEDVSSNPFILDHKTTTILGSTFFDQLNMSDQFPGYMWALKETTGIEAKGYIINVICSRMPTKTGKQFEFTQQPFYKPWSSVNEWRFNTIHLLQRFFDSYARGYFPRETAWCVSKYGKCPYYDVCELPPENRMMVLNSATLYSDNLWSPLSGPEIEKASEKFKDAEISSPETVPQATLL